MATNMEDEYNDDYDDTYEEFAMGLDLAGEREKEGRKRKHEKESSSRVSPSRREHLFTFIDMNRLLDCLT